MNRVLIFLLLIISMSCDDGNFDVPEFDFSSIDIQNCGDAVLFKINENETFVIEIDSKLPDSLAFLTYKWENKIFAVTESGANKITYRTLAEKPTKNYFCQNIPPTSPVVISEWIGTGNVLVNTELIKDDNDNVVELDTLINTDAHLGDIYPNYIDSDDDGDDLATIKEDVDGDGDLTNDDTDGNGIPNYLDEDDDGDGVFTINESTTEDANGNDIVDYLDPETKTDIGRTRNLKNSYDEIYKTNIIIGSLKLTNSNGNNINYDTYDFGTKTTKKSITQK